MLKAILVDFDGTLVFSEEENARAYSGALREFGIEVEADLLKRMIAGKNWRDFIFDFVPKTETDLVLKIVDRKRQIYQDSIVNMRLNASLLDLLRICHGHLKIALVTSASRDSVLKILGHHCIDGLFDAIVCSEDVAFTKPNPAPYVQAAILLGVSPDECIVLEDSQVGVAAGAAFGADVFQFISR